MPLPTPCIICGDHAHVVVAGTRALCRRPACQWTFHSTPSHERCTLCERPLMQRQVPDRVCDAPECQRQVAQVRREAIAERWRQARLVFERRAGEVRAAAAAALHVAEPETYELARIPHTTARTRRLPHRRRAAYAAHLTDIVTRVFEARSRGEPFVASSAEYDPRFSLTPDSADLRDVLARGCAQCRGACCEQGGTRAFIDGPTIERYLSDHPEQGVEEIVAAYMSFVGTSATQSACVNQGARGCTLPRPMRASVCNAFYCGGIREVAQALDGGSTLRVFYEASDGPTFRYAFVDVRDVRVVRRKSELPRS